jgi:hypothetical protein
VVEGVALLARQDKPLGRLQRADTLPIADTMIAAMRQLVAGALQPPRSRSCRAT